MAKPLILCIDDEKSILDSLENQLQTEFSPEFTIELAESAEEAREIIKENMANQVEIPVILADYLMPGCSGDQFLIWAHAQTPETRNIMLTGQAGLEAVTTAINYANLYRYIAKPWEKNDLILTIKEAISSFKQQKMIQSQNAKLRLLNTRLQQSNKNLDAQVARQTGELQRQKKIFQQVFDNSPDGMVIVNETDIVLQVNKSFGAMFHYALSEVRGKCLPELVVATEFRQESIEFRAKMMVGQATRLETQRRTKDGKTVPVALTAYPLQIDDLTQGAIVIYQDLTLKQETADLLERSYARRRRNDFFNGLAASQKKIENNIYAQGQLLGIDLRSSFLLLFLCITGGQNVFDLPVRDKETSTNVLIDRIIDRLSQDPQLYAWDTRSGIGILYAVPADHNGDIMIEKRITEELLQQCRRDFPEATFLVGIAEFWPDLKRFAERYRQARISALIGSKLHPDQNIHHYLEIGAFPLLSKLTDDEESERFLNRTIGKLMEYDKVNGTNLFHTLEKIIASDNLRRVSDEMFLHYKTIIFRKQSIEKILGVSLDTFEGRTLVGTAMALYYFNKMKDKV
jgi:PAS domain S-box-containing protein